MEITVRPVDLSEYDRWGEMFLAYGDFYKVEVTKQTLEAVWGWIFDERVTFFCDVAEASDGRLVAMTQYQHMLRSLGGGEVIYLSDLYVEPALRGAGIGRALIDHVIAYAADRDFAGVRWLTQDFNYAARRLYDSYASKTDFILYSVPAKKS